MRKKISFAGPSITQKEVDYVTDAVKTGWYATYDKHTRLLEKKVCDYLGVKYALATHCCTLALHLACASIGLKEGDEVIVTDHSWVATAHSVKYTGATCVFVDIDPRSLCISPAAIKKAVTNKTKAIMLVHNFGYPADMDEIMIIAKEHNLLIIEDAAPAMGSEYKGKKTGTFGDVACFSFQGAKIAAAGEGGVFVTDNEDYYKKAVLLANMGRTDRIMPFWSDSMGYQYTISNLSAACALAQLERIDELISIKRTIFAWYKECLDGKNGITMVKERPGFFSNCCYPAIFLNDDINVDRDKILAKFRELNIHARPGFPRMSQFPMYEARFDNPVAEKFEKRGIVLPSAADITEEDVKFVSETLLGIINMKIIL